MVLVHWTSWMIEPHNSTLPACVWAFFLSPLPLQWLFLFVVVAGAFSPSVFPVIVIPCATVCIFVDHTSSPLPLMVVWCAWQAIIICTTAISLCHPLLSLHSLFSLFHSSCSTAFLIPSTLPLLLLPCQLLCHLLLPSMLTDAMTVTAVIRGGYLVPSVLWNDQQRRCSNPFVMLCLTFICVLLKNRAMSTFCLSKTSIFANLIHLDCL